MISTFGFSALTNYSSASLPSKFISNDSQCEIFWEVDAYGTDQIDRCRNRELLFSSKLAKVSDSNTVQLLGMSEFHKKSAVHRDLRPDNILISPNGHAVVSNYTSAKMWHKTMHRRDRMYEAIGTPGYMAPEVLSDTVTQDGYTRSVDQWGFGAIIWEMITGRVRFPRFIVIISC